LAQQEIRARPAAYGICQSTTCNLRANTKVLKMEPMAKPEMSKTMTDDKGLSAETNLFPDAETTRPSTTGALGRSSAT
jgi:hypothetical protein